MAGDVSGNGTGVPPQAGILEGVNPVQYSPGNPIALFIVQAAIVIIFCQLLHYPLRLINQPRVIAEVIGGILLGPTVMMRIPNFRETIFPPESMPVFNNVANLGLIVFLFLVALEVDMRMFTQNWKAALSVGLAGMAIPFALGFGIAYGLYKEFHEGVAEKPIGFGVFGLFVGTALAITAFPVLCRILSELNLLRSSVGVTVLAAGIGNDVTGWVLLALCVALVNNSSGLSALWALLCCIGWTLLLVFVVRPPFMWLLRRTGSLQSGPTQGMVALTMLMVLASAWFTGAIGVHPIFGAFLAGLICPHDGGFAIKLTEKIEDLISVLFLPLYFALSGLNTNLGLLKDGLTWGYTIAVIIIAFVGKIAGGTLAAKLNKLLWRESFAIGSLMSCKGLVELIVLNIGLQAGILSETTFSMFVVMALVTTIATTPLTKALYPPWYQKKVERWRRGEIDWDGNPLVHSDSSHEDMPKKGEESQIRRLMVHLRLDSLPSLFTFITLLGSDPTRTSVHKEKDASGDSSSGQELPIKKRPLEVYGLRVIELTDRTSSVMHLTEGEDFYSQRDPVVNAFKTFSQLHDVAVSGRVAVVPTDSYAETLISQASDVSADFALIPWGEYGTVSEDQSFLMAASASERFRSSAHLDFINQTFQQAVRVCTTGIFIDNGFGGVTKPTTERPSLIRSKSNISIRSHHEPPALPAPHKDHHIFVPFFGGPDDRAALRLVFQLAKNQHVTVTVARIIWPVLKLQSQSTDGSGTRPATGTSIGAGTNDEVVQDEQDLALLTSIHSSLPADVASRIVVTEERVSSPTAAPTEVVALAQKSVGQRPKNAGDVVVLGRRNARLDESSVPGEVSAESGASSSTVGGGLDLKKTIGTVAEQLVAAGVKASVLVVQAGGKGLDN